MLLFQDPARATTSRFLSPRGFLCYKILATLYFVFWSVYWPVEEKIDDAHEFVTYWAWYMGTVCEFVLSYYVPRCPRQSMSLCWAVALVLHGTYTVS